MVSLSVLVPTPGRPELENCLLSLKPQLKPGDECIVIGDTCDGPLPDTEALVRRMGSNFRYLAHNAGVHDWGHSQMNAGMREATGAALTFIDDDDVWVPGALDVIRQAFSVAPYSAHLFRFVTYHGFLCWVLKGYFVEDYVGGHCLVCPNNPATLGKWSNRYQGDWDFVSGTVNLLGGEMLIQWHNDIIAIARPSQDVIDEVRRVASVEVAA